MLLSSWDSVKLYKVDNKSFWDLIQWMDWSSLEFIRLCFTVGPTKTGKLDQPQANTLKEQLITSYC